MEAQSFMIPDSKISSPIKHTSNNALGGSTVACVQNRVRMLLTWNDVVFYNMLACLCDQRFFVNVLSIVVSRRIASICLVFSVLCICVALLSTICFGS